jgi:2-polyprenyl-3-methyl-5-hydroxy-6-metoxy-1,4-benzoquinol methylase
LDQETIPTKDLYDNLKELDIINTWLGGHAVTIKGLKTLLNGSKEPITLADIGCGGGDNLRKMALWLRKKKIKASLVGIDIKPDCIEFAKQQCKNFPEISFIMSDYRNVTQKFDIVTSALFCHHLNNEEFQSYLAWSKAHSLKGFIINDLHRHTLAYYGIKLLTTLFSKSYLVKNDAPLSVWRGFHKDELEKHTSEAGVSLAKVNWIWAFRYLIIYQHVHNI